MYMLLSTQSMHYSALASNLSTRLYAIDSIDIIERCCCAIEYRIDTHSLRALLYMYIYRPSYETRITPYTLMMLMGVA